MVTIDITSRCGNIFVRLEVNYHPYDPYTTWKYKHTLFSIIIPIFNKKCIRLNKCKVYLPTRLINSKQNIKEDIMEYSKQNKSLLLGSYKHYYDKDKNRYIVYYIKQIPTCPRCYDSYLDWRNNAKS